MSKNALNSLYGEGHAQATDEGKGIRNQEILTPQCIVDGLLKFWPEGIEYEAAETVPSIVPYRDGTSTHGLIDPWPHGTYCNPPYGTSLFDPLTEALLWAKEKLIRDEAKKYHVTPKFPSGLPLKKAGLKDWLKMQLTKSEGESIMLVPNRTHRKWLRDWRRQVTALVELDPLTFHGFPQSFPAPLVLGLRVIGRDTYKTAARIGKFHEAFAHVGDPV